MPTSQSDRRELFFAGSESRTVDQNSLKSVFRLAEVVALLADGCIKIVDKWGPRRLHEICARCSINPMPSVELRAFQTLPREQLLPLLASSYEAGRLVPFIGAGMSRPKLASWERFVSNLEQILIDEGLVTRPETAVPSQCPSSSAHLAIKAQRIAATIRNSRSPCEFWSVIAKALRGEDFEISGIPEQTQALAEIYWPLTVSTNYDHLFYCACRKIFEHRLAPVVLGRSADDCKQIVSALVSPFDREIIWHIQGFLGEGCPQCHPGAIQDHSQLERLRGELIIGHPEYRKAANTAVHFRRCFAEVFRTRSLLFLGSNLSEEYFWNLFGETLELCGPSPVPHFALLKHDEQRIDARFLAEEMNVAVYEYKDHDELVPFLKELKERIEKPRVRASQWRIQLPGESTLEITPYCLLPMPDPNDTALALVVHAGPEGRFDVDRDLGDQEEILRLKFRDRKFGENEHVLSPEPGLFAVRARTKPESKSERDSVGSAVRELLGEIQGRWNVLHLHMPSAGGTVPPVYGFMEAVRAFGNWASKGKTPLRLIAHVGGQVFLNLTSRQIGLHELLTSELIRFWTVVTFGSHTEATRRVLYRGPETSLRDVLIEVLGDLNDNALEQWSISLCPSPKRNLEPLSGNDLTRTLSDVGVVFGSVLTLVRTRPELDHEKVSAAVAAGGI